MIKVARHWTPAILALSVVILTSSFVACGGNGEASTDKPTATDPAVAPTSDLSEATAPDDSASTAQSTPVAEAQVSSQVSLDEYVAICGLPEGELIEVEEIPFEEISEAFGEYTGKLESVEPPAVVADWHNAIVAYQGAVKQSIDTYLADPGGQSEDDYILTALFPVAIQYQPGIDSAIASMAPDVRARMIEAGCIGGETTDAVSAGPETQRAEIPVGGSASGTLSESEGIAYLQFQAEMAQKYLIEVAWEGLTRIRLLIKDPPDPVVSSIDQSNSSDSPFVRRWTAPESGTFHVEVWALEGAGSFNVSVSIDDNPDSPAGVSAAWVGSEVRVSWDPVDGVEYYVVYHDDRGPGCELGNDGAPRFCDELATNVVGTDYVHASPDPEENYFWVVACNREGCSKIDSWNPTSP